jgi:leader peptidase (prepilin peptidase) / N-methyltransferase
MTISRWRRGFCCAVRCRQCKTSISVRYFSIELVTALLFAGVYLWLFYYQGRQTGLEGVTAMQRFFAGGWLFYLAVMTLMAAFLVASAIDMELWIIPIQLCWFVMLVGLAASTAAGWVMNADTLATFGLFPTIGVKMSAATIGIAIGTLISLVAMYLGLIRPSYELDKAYEADKANNLQTPEPEYNHRKEVLKEILFLLPPILGGVAGVLALRGDWSYNFLEKSMQVSAVKGFMGSLAGYLAGCAIVWATRVFGTLAFGKEAMGLGDVHLMGAAGAVIGPFWVVLAFFIAPFFGILWALYQAIFKKIRQIPYGPFLSAAVFVVIIFRDSISKLISTVYGFEP